MLGESRRTGGRSAGPRPRPDKGGDAGQQRRPTIELGVGPRQGEGVEKIAVPRPEQNQTSRQQQEQTDSTHNRLLTPIDGPRINSASESIANAALAIRS